MLKRTAATIFNKRRFLSYRLMCAQPLLSTLIYTNDSIWLTIILLPSLNS